MLLTNIQTNFRTMARYMAMLCAFGIPWANGFFNVGFYLMMVFFILSLNFRFNWREIITTPAVIIALTLFTFILIRTIFSSAPWDIGRPDLFNYRKLLAIPVFISLFTNTAHKKQLAFSYCLGVCILMLPTLIDGFGYANVIEHMSFFRKNAVYWSKSSFGAPNLVYWRNHIVHGFHVSVLFSACIFGAFYCKKYKPLLITIALLCAIDLLFFMYGRMALLSLFFALGVIAFMVLKSKKHMAFFIVSLTLVAMTAYVSLPTVKARLSSIQSETTKYFSNEDLTVSAGQRLHFWKVSWKLFQDAPIFGAGSGFKYQLKIINDPLYKYNYGHTHNEYLTQLSLYGLVGFALLISIIIITLKNSRKIEDKWLANLTTTAICIFCLNALTDSSLHNDWEGWTFVLFASIACANIKPEKTRAPVAHQV